MGYGLADGVYAARIIAGRGGYFVGMLGNEVLLRGNNVPTWGNEVSARGNDVPARGTGIGKGGDNLIGVRIEVCTADNLVWGCNRYQFDPCTEADL